MPHGVQPPKGKNGNLWNCMNESELGLFDLYRSPNPQGLMLFAGLMTGHAGSSRKSNWQSSSQRAPQSQM